MNFREKFLNDLKCNVIVKGDHTFSMLANLYGYPEENGANLCKKDYYKFKRSCDNRLVNNTTEDSELYNSNSKLVYKNPSVSSPNNRDNSKSDIDIEKLTLRRAWEAQTPNGIQVLKSYQNDVTPQQIKEFRAELLEEFKNYSPVTEFVSENYDLDNNFLVLSLPDYHIGREAIQSETYRIYFRALQNIVERAIKRGINKILYVIGNDLFNSDTVNYQTTKGTQQYDYGTWKDTFLMGKKIVLDSIEYLKTKNLPIEVIFVEGNHDHFKVFTLEQVVRGYYFNDKQITFNNNESQFKVFHTNNVTCMFDHGELKPDDYPYMLATEYPKEWGNSSYRYIFTGHLHHTVQKDYRGNVKVLFLPSLAKVSDWEKSKGYKSTREAHGYIINQHEGLKDLIYYINN